MDNTKYTKIIAIRKFPAIRYLVLVSKQCHVYPYQKGGGEGIAKGGAQTKVNTYDQ